MQIHFISDLHLDAKKPGITGILLNYLAGRARSADQLYLLGDIFEYWLGDDLSQPKYSTVCEALRSVSESGVDCYFMHGNRDFLVGEHFSSTTGFQLLADPSTITIAGKKTLLSHGDSLCTDDIKHQEFRNLVTQPAVKKRLLSLPPDQREQLARQLRGMSKSGDSLMPADIMDVTQSSVEKLMQAYEAELLIHGHTHRCAMHNFNLNEKPVQRVVLADWHEDKGSVLICNDGELFFEILT